MTGARNGDLRILPGLDAEKANEGESLDVQRRQIEGYVHMHGFTLAGVLVEEGVSGSVPVEERPVGGQLFAKFQRGERST